MWLLGLSFLTVVFRISLKIKPLLKIQKLKILDSSVFKNFNGKNLIPLHAFPALIIVSSVSKFLNYQSYKA